MLSGGLPTREAAGQKLGIPSNFGLENCARSSMSQLLEPGKHVAWRASKGQGVDEWADCVQVEFRHASQRLFDLVIGADGPHSSVRELVFGRWRRSRSAAAVRAMKMFTSFTMNPAECSGSCIADNRPALSNIPQAPQRPRLSQSPASWLRGQLVRSRSFLTTRSISSYWPSPACSKTILPL